MDVPGWEEKGRWVFYLDILTDFVKLIVYLVFFAILLTFYGLPIHILRDVVVTIRSFGRRIMDFLRYRNATRDMNERYPDATAEEVAREEVCIICREDMVSVQPAPGADEGNGQPAANTRRVPDRLRPKKLPCGHILHFACLRSWLERQQNCPTCRRPVVGPASATGAAGGNANANGNGEGQQQNGFGGNQAPGQPGGQGEGLPRARVYQFGPFRIGFGAVRGDLFHNLHNQIHQGNAPLQPPVNPNPQGARQIGFGFGFGRRPLAAPAAPTAEAPQNQPTSTLSTLADIQNRLQQIEQQLAQEINAWRVATEQLQRVRALQVPLERFRVDQANNPLNNLAQPSAPTGASSIPSGTPNIQPRHQFVPSPGAVPLSAGDPRLPEGMTLPPDWTFIPLQSTDPNAPASLQGLAPTPTASGQPPHAPSSNGIIQPAAPVVSAASIGGDNAANEATPALNVTPNNNLPAGTASALPSWGSPNTTAEDHRADSLSQEWTDVQKDHAVDVSSSTGATWGRRETAGDSSTMETQSESTSKGKGRAATVEEAVDEEAS